MIITIKDHYAPTNEAKSCKHGTSQKSQTPVSSQNKWYWSSAKAYLIHEIPLCGLKVGMWCTIKAKQINGPIWHSEAILVDLQDEYWKNYLCSSTIWGTMFCDTVKSWQPICINFYLWGYIKDRVYRMHSCMEEELNTWKFIRNNCESISVFLNSKKECMCVQTAF